MKNLNSSSATNIIYIDHSNSSIEYGISPDTTTPDSISSIMKNNTIIILREMEGIKGSIDDNFMKPNPSLKPESKHI